MDDVVEPNRAKVRLGFALVGVVVLVSVVLFFAIDSPAGKALMFAIAATAFIRMYLLSRSVRRPAG